MILYLAGPMSGRPQFNFPMFDAAASMLRMQDWEVINPAELDGDKQRHQCIASPDGKVDHNVPNEDGMTWGDYLSRDVKLVADEAHAVVVLPGWETSKGARLEVFVAISSGKPVYPYNVATGGLGEPLRNYEIAATFAANVWPVP